MTLDSPILGIPMRIRRLQDFGVGSFNKKKIESKCAIIRQLMAERSIPRSEPLFSVVMPAHKEEGYILASLRSLAEQTNRDAEFIVVVNGEKKGSTTQRIAEECGFTVIHEPRVGVGRARQMGLRAARGKIVVTTDADTLHYAGWLDAIGEDWNAQESIVAGFGPLYILSTSLTYQVVNSLQNIARSLQGRKFFVASAEANSWYLREAALRVGGYEKDLNYWEGSSLMKKLTTLGELHGATRREAGVFTSDRRMLGERVMASTQYLLGVNPSQVPYSVVR